MQQAALLQHCSSCGGTELILHLIQILELRMLDISYLARVSVVLGKHEMSSGKANIALSLLAVRFQLFLPLFLAWLLCTSVFYTDNWLLHSVPRILMILITDYAVVKCWSSSACKALRVRHQVSLKNLSFSW